MLSPRILIAQCNGIPKAYNIIQKESTWIKEEDLNSYYPLIQYIGKAKDSIYIGIGSKIDEQLNAHKINGEFRSKYKIREYRKGKLSINICDSNLIKMSFRIGDIKSLERNILNCYSVVVKNVDSIPIDISIRKLTPIALEVEGLDGSWKTVIEEFEYWCTTGDAHYFIMPNEIVILEVPIIASNRKYRVRIGETYSNIFYQTHDKYK
jgi:hypothetical protein